VISKDGVMVNDRMVSLYYCKEWIDGREG
jgi:hypothetical protein